MAIHSAKVTQSGINGDNLILSSGQTINNFHKGEDCFGEFCSVHNPSDHTVKDWLLAFNGKHMVRIMPGIEVSEIHGIMLTGTEDSDKARLVVIDPDDYEFNKSDSAILRNSGICRQCGESIYSTHVHDYASCKCGSSFTDGGHDYIRQGGDIQNTSIVYTKL